MAERRWNYHVAEIKPGLFGIRSEQLQAELNRLGTQGWELVQVQMMGMTLRAFFKRAL
jgi:hypothetical protein